MERGVYHQLVSKLLLMWKVRMFLTTLEKLPRCQIHVAAVSLVT